jgi:hypothetical protein
VVSLGLVILALVYTPQMLSPEFRQQLAAMPQGEFLLMVLPPAEEMAEAWEKVENINPSLMGLYVMSAHLPFFVSGLVLYLFFWPRLLKVREFYADAGAASFLRNAGPVLEAMPWYDALVRLRPTPERHRLLPGWLDRLRPATWGLLSFHPSNEQRAECLKDPQKVYGSPARMALRAGLLVLLLEFILTGPFTLFYLRYTPVHFATLTGFVALAVALLPAVCQGGLTGRQWLKRIIGIISIFTALQAMLLLANLALVIVLLIVSPELLAALLELLVYITAGFVASGGPSPLFQADASLNTLAIGFTLSTAIFIITIWGTLISLLLADTYLKRLRLVMVCWVITFALAFSAAGLLVPLGIGVVQPGKLSAMVVVGYPLAAGLLIVVGGWLFYRAHRQHGRRCPSCSAIIPGWFYLGKRCPDCGQLLHGWLLADY